MPGGGPLSFDELTAFEQSLRDTQADLQSLASFFDKGEIVVVRVPARLDIMGGIADYSGSNVCEGTLGRGVILGIQKREDHWIKVRTQEVERNKIAIDFAFLVENFYVGERLKRYDEMRYFFQRNTVITWAAYIIGGIFTLLKEKKIARLRSGFNIALLSSVPMCVGIGSSATVECATIYALDQVLDLKLSPLTVAKLSQKNENSVVGAPCGIMDQIAVTSGRENRLIHILCQPDMIKGTIPIPENCAFAGINSAVKHSVAGPKYTDVRVATFMGRKIIQTHNSLRKGKRSGSPRPRYLCNVSPDEFEEKYKKILPVKIKGADFLEKYGETGDKVTEVNLQKEYKVRSRTAHPVYENQRVMRFMRALDQANLTGEDRYLVEAGEQMYRAHQSYARNCDLSAPEVDLLVDLVRKRGKKQGLYGAKITGGGSGGTVAILGQKEGLEEKVEEIAREYESITGLEPDLFFGTSPGAVEFGSKRYTLEWSLK